MVVNCNDGEIANLVKIYIHVKNQSFHILSRFLLYGLWGAWSPNYSQIPVFCISWSTQLPLRGCSSQTALSWTLILALSGSLRLHLRMSEVISKSLNVCGMVQIAEQISPFSKCFPRFTSLLAEVLQISWENLSNSCQSGQRLCVWELHLPEN